MLKDAVLHGQAIPQSSIAGAKKHVQTLLAQADVCIDGTRPWDIRVHNDEIYTRVLCEGSFGFGESFMDGWWECDAIDECVARMLSAKLHQRVRSHYRLLWHALWTRMANKQSTRRAFHIAEHHYNLGNDLYEAMLDETMSYSCGYWKNASTLAEAQRNKLHLICRKIGLMPGQRVLDIGCGWGSFAQFVAKEYGAHVVGVTVSTKQRDLALKRCAGLPVEILLQDYRSVQGVFDHVVSIGMFEHVGYKNHRTFFDVAARCLKDDGMLLLHTIGNNTPVSHTDLWIDRYIFPNSNVPAASQITQAYEGRFVMEDWHNFGTDYDKTLMAWHANFTREWPELRASYGERFERMWTYYLLSCAGAFRARATQLWQIVFSKNGCKGGYVALR